MPITSEVLPNHLYRVGAPEGEGGEGEQSQLINDDEEEPLGLDVELEFTRMEIIQRETAAFRDRELTYADIHNEEAEEEK